ncbi:hypothetical protein H112_07090 [Trichophyton rubrum D6]|uniref:Uncharacterized protein n=2 Tax=Trichophyton rubrum TaxID=5551 RepID=A0A080WJK2_TRIRC|nr:uncharacterized protein TERG_11846 [Trichophyton rubrum CBS 118892]EZF11874.1 hypothetical protein H100_07112 [Trichophyton rubrum MR850]EZF38766.1 hypothetical protein H102_07074 [Trichophyton rubrum CBS 100081]EZF49399.1 hypothetical protein H103_07095 [Trichophyton rubrum CBS 288.86]EZF60011.1 hypothetical protein H104_07051 [Trichophyton rubrum CBS 289.86]EZF81328.1 hypothetical protein H110_07091 [Trichophyton rubrum MR1448]EZF91965.1 hypothetical protein H113_07146 [Trichophyton rubr
MCSLNADTFQRSSTLKCRRYIDLPPLDHSLPQIYRFHPPATAAGPTATTTTTPRTHPSRCETCNNLPNPVLSTCLFPPLPILMTSVSHFSTTFLHLGRSNCSYCKVISSSIFSSSPCSSHLTK